jgi:hypothetical protein
LWETLALLLIAFTLFRPGFWWDRLYPPMEAVPGERVTAVASGLPSDGRLVLRATGLTIEGDEASRTVVLQLPGAPGDPGAQRLGGAGLHLQPGGEAPHVARLDFGSQAERSGLEFGWEIEEVMRPADRPPPELMYIPALLLLGGVAALQWRRRTQALATGPPA